MQNTNLKKQHMEGFFKETFTDVIEQFKDSIYFCGRKMYIKGNKVIISVDFAGTAVTYDSIILTASSIYGIIDQNVTPFLMLFKESKLDSGLGKVVNLKTAFGGGGTGEYTIVWSGELTDSDKMSLNNLLINYIELYNN